MTIYPYTFASIGGASFPVGANNDGRLYQILANKMKNGDIKRYDFTAPVNTALNRQYSGTAIIAGGRYFELINEQVVLIANTSNYITVNIDLSNPANPITISNESADLSNTTDINKNNGLLRVCFEVVTTNGNSVVSTSSKIENDNFQNITVSGFSSLGNTTTNGIKNTGNIQTNTLGTSSLTVSDSIQAGTLNLTSDVRTWTPITLSNVTNAVLMYKIINGVIHLNGQGNWGNFTANQSKTIATLPPELRPTRTVNKMVTTQNTNNNDKPMEIQIQEGGNINIWSMPASTSGRYGGFEESYPLG